MKASIFSKKNSFILLAMIVAFLLATLWHRGINVDDGWLAECAFYLSKLGYAKSEGMRGWLSADSKLFLFHKLFTYVGSIWGRFFGFGAYEMKSFSLLWTGLSCVLLFRNYTLISSQKQYGILVVTLFLAFHHTTELAFMYRPEMMVTFFALLAFLIYQYYLRSSNTKYLLLLGIASGAAVATHLNGVAIVGAFVLLLWIKKRYLAGFLVGCIAVWGIAFFFVDVRSMTDLYSFRDQFLGARDLSESHFGGLRYFMNLVLEQGRFFHSPPEILYSLLIMFFLFLKEGRRLSDALLFPLLLSICLGVVAHGKTPKYLLYAVPFFMMWVVLTWESLPRGRTKTVGSVVILSYVFLQTIYNYNYFNSRETEYNRLKQIAKLLPKDAKVLGDTKFFFVSQGEHQLQWYVIYKDMLREGKLQPTPEDFFQKAKAYGNEYVLIDSSIARLFSIQAATKYEGFELVDSPANTPIRVFRRVTSQ